MNIYQTAPLCLLLCVLDFLCQLISMQVYCPHFTFKETETHQLDLLTLLEIAEPESNPGLSGSKGRALVHVGTGGRIKQQLEGASEVA